MKADKAVKSYRGIYKTVLKSAGLDGIEGRSEAYAKRLSGMYASDKFKEHDRYPTMDVARVYAVIAMCLELKEAGLSDGQIKSAVNSGFESRRAFFKCLLAIINILPNSFEIVKKWNLGDHEKRVKDGSITYDQFEVSYDKVEYRITKCMYTEMFACYGIRGLCKIFCMTDVIAYERLERHIKFVRHSDMSDSDTCSDEVIRRR